MQKTLTPAERLIVAADFKPIHWISGTFKNLVFCDVVNLANKLSRTGVCLKVNSVLRACGYDLIDAIHQRGLKVFADLKLFDIGETLSTDGAFLKEVKPEILTTVCVAGVAAMRALKAELPDTEVLGVTVLTSINDTECAKIFPERVVHGAMRGLVPLATEAGLGGIICAPKDICHIREFLSPNMTINTPAIRPTWAIVSGDDQNPDRIMTPAMAIKAGADRIVVGRPIVKSENPYDAVMRTIEEIASATE